MGASAGRKRLGNGCEWRGKLEYKDHCSVNEQERARLCGDNFFVTKGENTFLMVKRDGKWLISGYDYPGEPQYEVSKTELYEFDPEESKKEWDKIYR